MATPLCHAGFRHPDVTLESELVPFSFGIFFRVLPASLVLFYCYTLQSERSILLHQYKWVPIKIGM